MNHQDEHEEYCPVPATTAAVCSFGEVLVEGQEHPEEHSEEHPDEHPKEHSEEHVHTHHRCQEHHGIMKFCCKRFPGYYGHMVQNERMRCHGHVGHHRHMGYHGCKEHQGHVGHYGDNGHHGHCEHGYHGGYRHNGCRRH